MDTPLIRATASAAVQEYIFSHEHEDEKALALKGGEVLGLPAAWLAQQISGRRKIKQKLPKWFETKGIVYPPSLNLEQTSSEATATYKSRLVAPGKFGVDLSGGFGVDSFFLAPAFESFSVVEPNELLLAVSRHNHQMFGLLTTRYFTMPAEEFVSQMSTADFIFIDPSRRAGQKKVFRFADCTPDIIALLPRLLSKASTVMVKASPLMDVSEAIRELKHVSAIHIVSVDNECREVLFILRGIMPGEDEISITAVDLNKEGKERTLFKFERSAETKADARFHEPLQWLYEPNASILKAGAFKLIAQRFELFKLHQNTQLYTSADLHPGFPGRIFRVVNKVKLDRSVSSLFPKGKANVISRNYPLTPDEIKKKTGLQDGGDLFLICTQSVNAKEVLIAERFIK